MYIYARFHTKHKHGSELNPAAAPESFHALLNIDYQAQTFSKQKRYFQSWWCKTFTWLHYDVTKDSVFSIEYSQAISAGKLNDVKTNKAAFLEKGSVNWKKSVSERQNITVPQRASSISREKSWCRGNIFKCAHRWKGNESGNVP